MAIQLIPVEEFERVQSTCIRPGERLSLLADMSRANTLASVKLAGSGHLGSSLSSIDIVTWLYFEAMNAEGREVRLKDRDLYFSSKGHDAPGLYAVLFACGILPAELFVKLRRYGGTHGHPDVRLPGVEANTGSLGMGISKAKGIALAKRLRGNSGRVYVMTGDGELQEGQIYEAMLSAASRGLSNLTAIVDHNKVQSDRLVDEVSPLGDLESKARSFGWHPVRCDGHDFAALRAAFAECLACRDKPQLVIADTIKGKGVSFMEHLSAMGAEGGHYKWHASVPDDREYEAAYSEVTSRIGEMLRVLGLEALKFHIVAQRPAPKARPGESVGRAYGEALVDLARRHSELVVLDGDLAVDCHIRNFELAYPERFFENGIAEQDMVSTAGGLALSGFLPVVNTFASFLAARANEQVYNNGSEGTRIIYAAHYAGLTPGEPGASHQSIRDIALFGSMPNIVIVEPANADESRMVVEYAVEQARENVVIRLQMGFSPGPITMPPGYRLTPGCGVTLADGEDVVLFAYGPVMLHAALAARSILAARGLSLRVVNMPWLNRIDARWLADILRGFGCLVVVDDHGPTGGLGDTVLSHLNASGMLGSIALHKFAVEGYPTCGTSEQVLNLHGLDSTSLARRILQAIGMVALSPKDD